MKTVPSTNAIITVITVCVQKKQESAHVTQGISQKIVARKSAQGKVSSATKTNADVVQRVLRCRSVIIKRANANASQEHQLQSIFTHRSVPRKSAQAPVTKKLRSATALGTESAATTLGSVNVLQALLGTTAHSKPSCRIDKTAAWRRTS